MTNSGYKWDICTGLRHFVTTVDHMHPVNLSKRDILCSSTTVAQVSNESHFLCGPGVDKIINLLVPCNTNTESAQTRCPYSCCNRVQSSLDKAANTNINMSNAAFIKLCFHLFAITTNNTVKAGSANTRERQSGEYMKSFLHNFL